MTVAAVVLAAGEGTRWDGPGHKLLAEVGGRPLVAHAIDSAMKGMGTVFVVTGAVDVPLPEGAVPVRNVRWRDGIATSLQAGLWAAATQGHDAVVVGLGDQPGVPPEAWAALAAYEERPIGVATYGGRRATPVRLAASVWRHLPASGDEGARVVMRLRPHLVGEVACPGDPADVDRMEDLRRWS